MGKHTTLLGSTRLPVPGARNAGPVDPNEPITLTVRVRSRPGSQAIEDYVAEQSALPLDQRSYLTQDQLRAKAGADPADLDKVEDVAHRHNLIVAYRSVAERVIVLRGRISDMLAAFPADVHIFHHADGAYRGRRGAILIPTELKDVVTGVFGYDTRPKHRARVRHMAHLGAGGTEHSGQSPGEFADRYQFPTEQGGVDLDGAGQTIGIIELGGGYRTSDLALYFQELGVPMPNVVSVSVDHGANMPSGPKSADGEVMLDLEVCGAVAPAARQVVYFAPNNGNRGFMDAISAAIHDDARNPSVISISWGMPEDFLTQNDRDAYSQIFAAAAALGVTVCAASGDHGVADLDASRWDKEIHVDHPAADPFVLACGGTQIADGVDVVWNDGTTFDLKVAGGGGWAGGGGVSIQFPLPDYQASAGVPISLRSGAIGRGVPDIAMSATNYFVRVDSVESISGGTSAVAPLMAALVARLNQAKGKRVGFLNPFLYSTHGIVEDVAQGTNGIVDALGGYSAVSGGWDPCTGLGTPIGTAILAQL